MTELEQKLLEENERLRRELDELKQKLKADTAPRVEYVDEKTRRFRGELYRKSKSTGYYVLTKTLHVEVYKFYNELDEIPKNCLVHHDGKDESGNYDKEKNDIEYLVLMTRAAHTALHNPSIGRFELFTCKICGKTFMARKMGKNYICAYCGKEFEVQKYKTQKYCSNRCGALAQWERQKS